MITTDYEVLAEEMARRGWDFEQLGALSKVVPHLGTRDIRHGVSRNLKKELTYRGKSRRDFAKRK